MLDFFFSAAAYSSLLILAGVLQFADRARADCGGGGVWVSAVWTCTQDGFAWCALFFPRGYVAGRKNGVRSVAACASSVRWSDLSGEGDE